jgi:hypothetical protein
MRFFTGQGNSIRWEAAIESAKTLFRSEKGEKWPKRRAAQADKRRMAPMVQD